VQYSIISNDQTVKVLIMTEAVEKSAKFADFVGTEVELIGKGKMAGAVGDKSRDVTVTEITSLKKYEGKKVQ
jgi:hypothetical protein